MAKKPPSAGPGALFLPKVALEEDNPSKNRPPAKNCPVAMAPPLELFVLGSAWAAWAVILSPRHDTRDPPGSSHRNSAGLHNRSKLDPPERVIMESFGQKSAKKASSACTPALSRPKIALEEDSPGENGPVLVSVMAFSLLRRPCRQLAVIGAYQSGM